METSNEITRRILSEYGTRTLAKLAAELRSKGKVATGSLVNSLSMELRDFITSIILDFEGEDYIQYIIRGRRAGGKMPPLRFIEAWCKVKNIEEKYAYPIARKIARDGIPPTPFIEDAVESDESFGELNKALEENYEQQIEFFLENIFK